MMEFIFWGKPPAGKYEEPLLTAIEGKRLENLTDAQVKRLTEILESHGCTEIRVQRLDMSTAPDFTKTINR